jgi:cytochrome c oxidase subunit 2
MTAARVLLSSLVLAAPVLSACQGRQSILDPASRQASDLAVLSWILFGVGAVILFVVMVLLLAGISRARGARQERPLDQRHNRALVVYGGVVIPLGILVVFLVASAVLGSESAGSSPPEDAIVVEVTGHRWWWEVHYLDRRGRRIATLANELYAPLNRPVRVNLRSNDVIHSFWAPNLQGKKDMIPGRTNVSWFTPTRQGIFRGQCAEFCGEQHGKMAFFVVVVPQTEFDAWLARQQAPAAAPLDARAEHGQQVFLSAPCVMCHAVRGTTAMGQVAPDLTHFASRQSLAAGVLPNNRGALAAWIVDPQHIKPGTRMPATRLRSDQLQALLHYLDTLR